MSTAFLSIFGDAPSLRTPTKAPNRALTLETFKHALDEIWHRDITRTNANDILRKTIQYLNVQWSGVKGTTNLFAGTSQLAYLIPRDKLELALTAIIVNSGAKLLALEDSQHILEWPAILSSNPSFDEDQSLVHLIDDLRSVGLWGVQAEIASAIAADELLDRLIWRLCTQRQDNASGDVSTHLEAFVEVYVEGLVRSVPHLPQLSRAADLKSLAFRKLARLRSIEFFDIVEARHKGHGNTEAVLKDLRACATKPEERRFLLEEFSMRLERDLLHPGRSTVDILDIFVHTVHLTKLVDPHGSLLNEVGKSFRQYMKLRDDAVRIMLINFLEGSKQDEESSPPDWAEYSAGIANSVKSGDGFLYSGDYFEGMDLRDLSWQPEPVDASTGHQASKALDDLGHLIKLAEQKTFVADLQMLYRARLLGGARSDYVQEMDLLQLLKRRFDQEGAFQNVEVMINDVLQSHSLLRKMVGPSMGETPDMHGSTASSAGILDASHIFSIPFGAHVLSRAYWTNVEAVDFRLPTSMQEQATAFEERFKILHEQKQLQWTKQLGHATVQLELADRTFNREVTTAQASVIGEFDSPDDDSKAKVRTYQELQSALNMDEALLRSCLSFWIAQEILSERAPNQYQVLETLDPGHSTAQAVAAEASLSADPNAPDSGNDPSAAPAELKSAADLLSENGLVYGNFIAALLTNQGGMPAQRIHMILANMMPGGFPFTVEDLVGFLREMAMDGGEGKGRVETVGGSWRIRKK